MSSNPGEFKITFGKKYSGRMLKEIPRAEVEGYIKWLENSSLKPGTKLANDLTVLKAAFAALYGDGSLNQESPREPSTAPPAQKAQPTRSSPPPPSGTRNYKTAKGTELPLLNLRGKEYLEVKYRLVWFREDHPDWSIETELMSVTEVSAYARATIRDEAGRIIATSHKFESVKGFPDFIEKAETGSIGRALALIGYGTQFCADELDEGARIVDSPVANAGSTKK